jgi:hypothetical protein
VFVATVTLPDAFGTTLPDPSRTLTVYRAYGFPLLSVPVVVFTPSEAGVPTRYDGTVRFADDKPVAVADNPIVPVSPTMLYTYRSANPPLVPAGT